MIRQKLRNFIFTLLKSLNPKYYTELGDMELSFSVVYFFALVFIAFIIMSIIAVPKLYFIESDIKKSLADIEEFGLQANLKTAKPILIPQDLPLVTLDTTNNKTIGSEILLITDKKIFYNILRNKGELEMRTFKATEDRSATGKLLLLAVIALLPSLFFFYYLAYIIKYLLIIIPGSIIAFIIAKIFRNKISLKQAFTLSFFTATPMVLIEILTLPFFIRDYLFSYSLFGINFSLVAITLYLIFYVTSIRINGNMDIK